MEATGGKTVYSARYDTLLPAEKSALWDSFSEWRASNCMHQEASISNLKSTLLAMQANFMDQSQYIRGDYVWQKSIAQFLHEMNDLVQGKLDRLYSENESYCSSFCIQIAQFFQQKNKQHQCDLSRERVIFEEKVRKVRQTFKIEKANSAVLEKCLRQQEMLQLKSRFDMSVAQLETEHAEREKLLTQAIIELKSTCNLTQTRAEELSFAYQQNLVEIEQLREEVVASKQSNVSKTVTTPPKEEMTTKSLTDARQSVATLKVKLLEMQAEKMSISERFAQITRDFHKISEDLILMRNHASKLDREMFEKTKRIAELEENSFASKEMRMEFEIGFERLNLALTEKSRLCDCLLEKQERLEKTLLKEIEEANEFDECDVQIKAPASKDSKKNLWEAARKFYDWKSDHSKIEIKVPTDSFTPLQLECSHALQLRLEMEQKFGAQLQARVVQERNFVLAYLRAQNRNKQKAAAFMQTLSSKWKKRQTKAGLPTSYASLRDGSMLAEAESVLDLYTFIEHLVAEAYDKLGYTDWNDTDIAFLQEERNSLKDRVGRYEAQLQHQQEQIQKHLHHAAKSQLLHQEKEFLLAELNTRHRELRRSYEEAIATRETSINSHLKSNECSVAQNTIKSLSLIHYNKSSSQPAMINTGLRAVGLKSQSPRSEAKNMDESGSFSSLPVRPVGRNPNEKRRDHVRGLLKEELMSTTAHSSNDNHAVVGSDGLFQIFQRRLSRRKDIAHQTVSTRSKEYCINSRAQPQSSGHLFEDSFFSSLPGIRRHTKMNANWQPQSNLLEQVVSLLKAYLIPNNDIQRQSYERLQQFQQNLEFNLYLVHILSNQSSQFSPDIRQLAGLLLKRNIKSQNVAISTGKTSAQMEMLAYIRSQIICILADSNQSIRNTASSLVTTFVSQYTFIDEWPELMPALFQYLEQQDNVDAIAGAFSALCKICEDSASRLESSPTRPLNKLIPILLQYFHHPTSQFRQDALNCINHVLVFMPVGLVIHMEGFLQGISNLTQDANNQVRRLVCKSIVILLEVGVQYLAPHLDQIIQFILRANEDDDEEIAIEACEFWASFVDLKEFKDLKPILQPYLPRVLPLLFSKMVYSEEDLATFEAEEQQQNESVPDRPEDIKPIFHKTVKKADGQIESSLKPQSVEAQCTSETTFKGACGVTNVHVGDDSEDEDDEDDDDDDSMLQWNLRRCSAASLDNLANGYGNQVLPVLLPLLQERLSLDGPWPLVESGILALGAIADGCYTGITPHLPQLFPFLMQKLNDPAPFIRSITCWTLSRYASWIVDQSNHDQFLKPLMEGMLQRILDPHKKVQEAACSAFCTLEEEAREDLIPYLGFILQTFMCAFAKYQAKNLLILYDAIGTLADSVSSHLNEKEFIAVLMPPLLSKWNELADNSREILPLFECLASVASALGNGFEEFALIVYGRCQRIVENELMADAMYEQNPTDCDAGDPEFLVCALDLISGIVEGIQCQCEGLLMGSNILNILANCIQHSTLDVRQSAMGVIGDIAKYAPAILKPGLEQMIPILVHNIDPEIPTVCNNASWSVGEIAMQLRGDMEPFVHDILTRLIGMINRPKLPRNLIENCAITIGRLGYVCPHQVAPYLKEFAKPWCRALAHLNSMEEKEECFLGLCYVIQANPNGIVADFVYFCGAIASLQGQEIENQELKQMLYQLVHSFKQSMGENWANYFAAFPKSLQTFLSTCFHI